MIRLGNGSSSARNRELRVRQTKQTLIEAALRGDTHTLQLRHQMGVDLAFDQCAILRALIDDTRKTRCQPLRVIDYLINGANIDPNTSQLRDRPLLAAVKAHKWNIARVLIVFGAHYRDLIEYAPVLALTSQELARFQHIVDSFRNKYLVQILKMLEAHCSTNASLPALIMSFIYPLEFKSS
jgi:hypothetical protein